MPTKIRLQRHGRKGRPFYHIVIADGRAPRDGRFIEKIGVYNPLTKPADIDLDFDRALYWLQTGAQPTDTVRTIFSHKGVLYKLHLLNGVKKGALTPEQVEERFSTWLEEKESKIRRIISDRELQEREELKKIKEQESKLNEARSAEIAKKLAKQAEKEAAKLQEEAEAALAEEEQAEQSETPAETEKSAAETEETPVETEKPAAETEETPAETEKSPAETEKPAAETEEPAAD